MIEKPRLSGTAALLVFLGGTLGTAARMTLVVPDDTVWSMIGVAAVNIIGSFALGYLTGWSHRHPATRRTRTAGLFVGTGILGGFTTYSAFAVQGAGGWWLPMTVLTVGVGVAVAWGGINLGRGKR